MGLCYLVGRSWLARHLHDQLSCGYDSLDRWLPIDCTSESRSDEIQKARCNSLLWHHGPAYILLYTAQGSSGGGR